MIENNSLISIFNLLRFKNITISTWFTISRILLIPLIVFYIIIHKWQYAILLFFIASLTDIIDGFLARYLKQETILGALLDPFADKLLIISCYMTLVMFEENLKIPVWFIVINFLKEFLLIFGTILLSYTRSNMIIKPSMLGKFTTVVQTFFICLILLFNYFTFFDITTFHMLLLFISLLNISVFLQYFFLAYRNLKHEV